VPVKQQDPDPDSINKAKLRRTASRSQIKKVQCWRSVTFWCGSGSSDPHLGLVDSDPGPTPDPTPLFSDFEDANSRFVSQNLPAGTLSSALKFDFLLKCCVQILFCEHYFNPLNTFVRKGKEPDPGRPKNMRILCIRFRIRVPNTARNHRITRPYLGSRSNDVGDDVSNSEASVLLLDVHPL
jgi:hypothetical protein